MRSVTAPWRREQVNKRYFPGRASSYAFAVNRDHFHFHVPALCCEGFFQSRASLRGMECTSHSSPARKNAGGYAQNPRGRWHHPLLSLSLFPTGFLLLQRI